MKTMSSFELLQPRLVTDHEKEKQVLSRIEKSRVDGENTDVIHPLPSRFDPEREREIEILLLQLTVDD